MHFEDNLSIFEQVGWRFHILFLPSYKGIIIISTAVSMENNLNFSLNFLLLFFLNPCKSAVFAIIFPVLCVRRL